MLSVGQSFPQFEVTAVVSTKPGHEFAQMTQQELQGHWAVMFFWPMDFTFVCPTEIAEFGRRASQFGEHGAKVYGVSTDTQYVHLAWRTHDPQLRDLPIPMLADTKRELSTALGILDPREGVPLRATYIIDPEGIIRHVSVNDLSVGRSVDEVLRILAALRTGELTPCGWRPGQATL